MGLGARPIESKTGAHRLSFDWNRNNYAKYLCKNRKAKSYISIGSDTNVEIVTPKKIRLYPWLGTKNTGIRDTPKLFSQSFIETY